MLASAPCASITPGRRSFPGVDDGGEILGRNSAGGVAELARDAPLRDHPRGHARGVERDDRRALPFSRALRTTTASIDGSWWRTACTFSSCSSVDATADASSWSLRM